MIVIAGYFINNFLDNHYRYVNLRQAIRADHSQLVDSKVFYINSSELYQINKDGSERETIPIPIYVDNFQVVGDWLYYSDENLYRARLDGSQEQQLSESVDNWFIYEDWIWYTQDQHLCRMNTDGEASEVFCQYAQPTTFCFSDDWIYFFGGDFTQMGFYKMNIQNRELIYICEGYLTYHMAVVDDWIYFIDEEGFGSGPNNLYRVRTDGSDMVMIGDVECVDFDIFDDWIYYSYDDSYEDLFRVRTDGSELEETDPAEWINGLKAN